MINTNIIISLKHSQLVYHIEYCNKNVCYTNRKLYNINIIRQVSQRKFIGLIIRQENFCSLNLSIRLFLSFFNQFPRFLLLDSILVKIKRLTEKAKYVQNCFVIIKTSIKKMIIILRYAKIFPQYSNLLVNIDRFSVHVLMKLWGLIF